MRRTSGPASDPINGEYVPLAEPDRVRAMSAASSSPLMSWLGAVGPAMFFGTVCLLIVLVIQQWFFVIPAMSESAHILEDEARSRKEEQALRSRGDRIEALRKQVQDDREATILLQKTVSKLSEDNFALAEQVKRLLNQIEKMKGG